MKIKKTLGLVLFFMWTPLFIGAQTSPEAFLGHKVGADRKLADYNQIQAYFQKLDQESGKLKVFTIGQTTLNKSMIMAVITSDKNMGELDKYRQLARQLRDARDLSPEAARKLAKEGKVFILLSCTLHSTEIGGSQEALELAYRLVTGKTPFDAAKVLDDVIVLLVPTANPDGQQMVTDWYRKYVGTKYEGGPMPWLYQTYAGHDNNRDFVTFNLAETKALSKILWQDWLPQIHDDKHQMGTGEGRAFFPPYIDPADPNIHPLLFSGIDLLGANVLYDLQKADFKGVEHGRSFASAWWKGSFNGTAMVHNSIGVYSEIASAKVATPVFIEPTTIPDDFYQRSLLFPDPWRGGWWRLRDIVDYELTISFSLIETAFRRKEDFLFNFFKMGKDSIEAGKKDGPYAFVISREQDDYPTTLRLIDILMIGGAEIHQAREAFVADGKAYPAGSFVVLMSQPYRPYVKGLLENRKYPDFRIARILSDNASWSLPLQMGVSYCEIESPFAAKLEKLDKVPFPAAVPPTSAPYIVLDSRSNASYAVAIALLAEKAEIYRTKDIVANKEFQASAGSFLVKNTPPVQKIIPGLLAKWHLTATGLENIADIPKAPLKNPRVGLYQSWRGNADEGWTRYVFDDFKIPFATLHNEDFKAAKPNKINLNEKFDVIIFADENADMIKSGRSGAGSGSSGRSMASYPPEYEGGIGEEGVEALKSFVGQGGILVTLNNACRLAIREFRVPARDVLEGVPGTLFFCPKSLLKINVDNHSPIGYGLPAEAAAMFYQSLAFESWLPATPDWEQKIVASYPEDNVVLRGGILGENLISRKAAVIDAKYMKGHIVLIGFLSQHRGQTHGTYKFLFNALLYPEIN